MIVVPVCANPRMYTTRISSAPPRGATRRATPIHIKTFMSLSRRGADLSLPATLEIASVLRGIVYQFQQHMWPSCDRHSSSKHHSFEVLQLRFAFQGATG